MLESTPLPTDAPQYRGGVQAITVGLFLLAASFAAAPARAGIHHQPTGPDAFLNYQVDSSAELAAALRSQPRVLDRFARHFHVSGPYFLDYARHSLVPYRLPESRAVTVYGITRTGRIYLVRERLRKGTRVWATRTGVPVLKWACANPLLARLPAVSAEKPLQPLMPVPGTVGTAVSSELGPEAEMEAIPVPAIADLGYPEMLDSATLELAQVGLTTPGPVGGAAGMTPLPAIASGGGGGFGWIPIGVLVGGLIASDSGGGGGVVVAAPPAAAEAPEPGSLALALAGAGLAAAAGWRRRSRSRVG